MLKAQDFPQVLYSPDLPEKQMPYDDWAWLLDGFGHPLDTLYHGARLDFHMFVRRCSSTQSSTPTKTSPPRSPDKTFIGFANSLLHGCPCANHRTFIGLMLVPMDSYRTNDDDDEWDNMLQWDTNWLVVSNIFYFPFHIWDVILPIDELRFFRGVGQPPTR